jgi:hypothetical protein
MPLVLSDHGTNRGDLKHVMPLRLWVVAVQRLLATDAERGFQHDDLVDLCHWYQRPRLAAVPGLSTRPTPTGLTAAALPLTCGRIARRGPR